MDTRTCVVLAAHRCAAASLQHATFSPRSIGFPSSVRWASTTPFDVDFEVRNMADKVTIEQHACLRSSVELCVPPLLGVYPYGPQQPLLQQPCHDCARSLLQAIPIQSSSTSVAQYRGQLKEGATVSSHQDHSAISHMQSPLSIAQPTTGLNRSAHHWSHSLSPPLVSVAQPTTGLNRSAHHWSHSLSPPLVSIAQPTTGLSRSAHHWSQSLSPPLVPPQRLPCFRFSQLSPDRLPAITPPSHTCNLLSQSLRPLVRSQCLPCTQLNPNPHPPQLQFADARLEIEDCADSVGTTVSVVIGVPFYAVCTCKRSWLSAAASKQSSLPPTHPRVHSVCPLIH
jgi:hypothetical protein